MPWGPAGLLGLFLGVALTVAGAIYTFAPPVQERVCDPSEPAASANDSAAAPACHLRAYWWWAPFLLAGGAALLALLVGAAFLWVVRHR